MTFRSTKRTQRLGVELSGVTHSMCQRPGFKSHYHRHACVRACVHAYTHTPHTCTHRSFVGFVLTDCSKSELILGGLPRAFYGTKFFLANNSPLVSVICTAISNSNFSLDILQGASLLHKNAALMAQSKVL